MMEKSYLLPWKEESVSGLGTQYTAETKVEEYYIKIEPECSVRRKYMKGGPWGAYINDEVENCIGLFDTLDAAMDFCEERYIEICTEYLDLKVTP